MKKDAGISALGQYRYYLTRIWDEDKGKVLFIMLNPSTADAEKDDATTTRCINYAKKWGYGGIMIGNIYPYRTKSPKILKKWLKRYGGLGILPHAYYMNTSNVKRMAEEADLVICAWGGNYKGTPKWLKELNVSQHYLELSKDGLTPKHPLGNLSKDLKPKRFLRIPYSRITN